MLCTVFLCILLYSVQATVSACISLVSLVQCFFYLLYRCCLNFSFTNKVND